MTDPYIVLGVKPDASDEEIKRAYRELARNHGAIPIASVLEDFAQPDGPTRFQDGERINLAGVVSAAKTKTTKNNSLMAYHEVGHAMVAYKQKNTEPVQKITIVPRDHGAEVTVQISLVLST